LRTPIWLKKGRIAQRNHHGLYEDKRDEAGRFALGVGSVIQSSPQWFSPFGH
jgi:hypothetical protein